VETGKGFEESEVEIVKIEVELIEIEEELVEIA
jgi:hypothetical protein